MAQKKKNDAKNIEKKVDDTGKDSDADRDGNINSLLLRRPLQKAYPSLPSPTPSKIKPEEDSVCEENIGSMAGFQEFRKFRKANETRTITPYEDTEENTKSKLTSEDQAKAPEIKIEEASKFLLEKIEGIPISDFRSIIDLVRLQPEIGFVTMNREHMDLVNDYQPYTYTIRHYNDIDKTNYVTISPNGIVEFYKEDADFLPTDQLQMEYEFFNKLKEIPSFQSFQLWKAFMVWLSKIRRRKFNNAKDKLESFFQEKYKAAPKKQRK